MTFNEAINRQIWKLEAYKEILDKISTLEKWYMTPKTDEDGEIVENEFVDEEYPESKAKLQAIRATVETIKKMAGIQ